MVGALLENQILAGELAHASRLTVMPGRSGNSSGRCSRHVCRGSPDWKSRRVTSHWAGRAAISTTSFLSTSAGQPTRYPHRPSRWCVFIGDIEGHGLAAAMVMAIVQAVLHVHPPGSPRPRAC